MRTEHLKYFLNLVETGSITQTSKELYTTHQNVSKIIRQLEEDLGTTLFIRTTKGIELTATGNCLYFPWRSVLFLTLPSCVPMSQP